MLKYNEEGYAEQGNDFAIVHQPQEKAPEDAPYKLMLEFEHKKLKDGKDTSMSSATGVARSDDWDPENSDVYAEDESCPAVEVRLLVEPIYQAENSIKCTDQEL